MKKSSLFLYIFAVFFAACNTENAKQTNEQQTETKKQEPLFSKNIPLEKCDFSQLQNGDILLKCGFGGVSAQIVKLLKERAEISHCGIVIKNVDSTYIIHSVAKELSGRDGVQNISIKDFISDTKPGSLFVLRLKKDKKTRDNVAEKAKTLLKRQIPFDYEFNLEDTTKMYCSEIVRYSVKEYCTDVAFATKITQTGNKLLLFNSLIEDTLSFESVSLVK